MKKIITFFTIYCCWMIGGLLFHYNDKYYKLLNLPNFIFKPTIISFIWIILYACISISLYKIIKECNILKNKDYFYTLITNYLSNELFCFSFFYLMSPFLGFIITLIVFVSSIFLFIETKRIKKEASYYLLPYIVFNFYSLLMSFFVFIFNF